MRYVLTIAICMSIVNVYAGDAVTTISRLGAATEQYAMMIVDVGLPTKPTCAEENNILSFDKSTPHGQDMFALALSALTANKQLMISYSETSCGLWGSRTLVNRIDILK